MHKTANIHIRGINRKGMPVNQDVPFNIEKCAEKEGMTTQEFVEKFREIPNEAQSIANSGGRIVNINISNNTIKMDSLIQYSLGVSFD